MGGDEYRVFFFLGLVGKKLNDFIYFVIQMIIRFEVIIQVG